MVGFYIDKIKQNWKETVCCTVYRCAVGNEFFFYVREFVD